MTERFAKRMDRILATIFILNSIDALMTIVWVSTGVAHEANPVMETVIMIGPGVFFTTKLALVGLGSILIWRLRHRGIAVVSALVALVAYLAVAGWHLYNIISM
jgi:hypothetical protein